MSPELHKRWTDSLREAAEVFDACQDEFVEYQAMIREKRHKDGYALVEDTREVMTTMFRVLVEIQWKKRIIHICWD
ncbi:hypothetical protein E2562_004897 [Oryza meyeriana var. granulata]|uniref:Uncharacterized protein n=1 Tax=Oryza meyeriana var. granulata TaxID=110450 RepID=A0A6G1C502_9ORYZ|nr:hypothetical protein E2562_004897 [Oryza meyeriana var. granulata]